MRLLLRRAAARWAALRLFGGAFRSARGPLWRLGLGLGLGLAATAVAVAGPDGGSEERPPGEPGFQRAVARSRDLLQRLKDEVGAPGVVVGVSVDGREVWAEGIGYADLENRVLCGPETVLRIASISKSLTMVAVAKLWEEGKLDLDAAVQKYVPEFPEKEYEGEKVTISTRLLVSHLSGIRHYEKDISKVKEEKEKANRKAARTAASAAKEKENKETEKRDLIKGKPEQEGKNSKSGRKKREFEHEEYYLKDKFEHVIDSLNIFQNDPLFFKPGSQFLYSTHGFTLLSAVVERASNQKFTDYMLKIFSDLGMGSTGLDENEPLIYNRARYYIHNKKGHVINAPYVDNSYKWAGGGFVSTVGDLLRFGNVMLYSYQLGQVKNPAAGFLPGYLKPDTIAMMWTTVPQSQDYAYGMAWFVVEKKQEYGHCKEQQHYTFHTGGAVGASSVLLILPEELNSGIVNSSCLVPPHGVVITVICNMQSVHLDGIALKIAKEFEKDRMWSRESSISEWGWKVLHCSEDSWRIAVMDRESISSGRIFSPAVSPWAFARVIQRRRQLQPNSESFPSWLGQLPTEATLAIRIIDAKHHIANTMESFVHDQASDQVLALQLCLVGYCLIINLLPTWAADCHYSM